MITLLWKDFKNKISAYPYIYYLEKFLIDLKKNINIDKIYIFGSLSKNNYDFNSDADLILILNKSRGFKVELQYLKKMKYYKKIFHIFPYSIKEFNDYRKDKNHFINKIEMIELKF